MLKINSYKMPIHTKQGATVTTPDHFAMKARCNRLRWELKINSTKKV